MKQSRLFLADSGENQRLELFQDYLPKSILLLLVILFSLVISVQAQDLDPNVNGKNVNAVVFTTGTVEGSYKQISGKDWGEFDQAGNKAFSFEETGREEWIIHLKDKNRPVTIDLDLSTKKVLINGSPYYNIIDASAGNSNDSSNQGENINGTNVQSVTTTNGIEFASIGGGNWAEIDASGKPGFYFKETNRDEWSVYLNDINRANTKVALDLYQKKVKLNGNPIYDITKVSLTGRTDIALAADGDDTSTNNTSTNNQGRKGTIKLQNVGNYDLKIFIGQDREEHDKILLQKNEITLNDIALGTYLSFRSVNTENEVINENTQPRPIYIWTLDNGYIYNIKASDGITDRQDIIAMRPNTLGVDIAKLDPQNIYAGLSDKEIFEPMEGNTSRDYHSADSRFIKDGFNYIKNPKGIGNGQTRMMYQSESIKKQWSVNVDLSGNVPIKKVDVSGGGGVGYKQYDETYKDQKDIYIEKSQSKCMYDIKCDISQASLASKFKQAIKALPLTYSKSAYAKIVDDYGTHYLEEVTYGGFYNSFITMSENAYSQLKGNSLDVKAKLGVHMSSKSKKIMSSKEAPSGEKMKYSNSSSGGDLAVGFSKSEDRAFHDLSSQMRMGYAYGGGSGDFDNWQLMDEDRSVPITIKPQLISELISIEVFRDETDPQKLATIKANMETYLADYINSMPKPKPIPAPPVTYTLEILDIKKVKYIDDQDTYHGMDLDIDLYAGALANLMSDNPNIDIAKGEMKKRILGMKNEHPDKLNKSKFTMIPKISMVVKAGNPDKRVFKIMADFREGNNNLTLGHGEEYEWVDYINLDLSKDNPSRTAKIIYHESEHRGLNAKQEIKIELTYRLTREDDFFIPIGMEVEKPTNTAQPELVPNLKNQTEDWKVHIDFCHDHLGYDSTKSENLIMINLYAGDELVTVFPQMATDKCFFEISTKSSKELTHIIVKNTGGDALYIDAVYMSLGDKQLKGHGQNGGKGWCLSTDQGDYGGWEGQLDENRCYSELRFDF